ncbi:MAG: RNA methyltransferase [Planctomycetes bacterium]|nr:RNA methyltransferase [Planctomycetota bacterium]
MSDTRLETIVVNDAGDPRLADYHGLSDRLGIHRGNRFICEGRLIVEHLVYSGYAIRSVFLAENWLERMGPTLALIPVGVPIYVAPEPVLDRIIGFAFHRGILACGEIVNPPTATDLIQRCSRLVVLEDLSNHDNMGSIFRSTSALWGSDTGVLLSPGCCHPLYRKSVRVSMGHALRIPFATLDPWPGGLQGLKASGFRVLGLTPGEGSVELRAAAAALARDQKVALLLGAEGPGLASSTLAKVDQRVRIDIAAHADSLNVGVAAAIAMYHLGVSRQGVSPA